MTGSTFRKPIPCSFLETNNGLYLDIFHKVNFTRLASSLFSYFISSMQIDSFFGFGGRKGLSVSQNKSTRTACFFRSFSI